jgi:hypothetical protein
LAFHPKSRKEIASLTLFRISLVSAFAAVLLLGLASVGAAQGRPVRVAPKLSYFESLGEIKRATPLRGEEGFAEGLAYGMAIVFDEDFNKTDSHRGWVLHTPRVPEGDVGDEVCYQFEECTLWIPKGVRPFEVPLDIPRTE